jgi:hypothetical protein
MSTFEKIFVEDFVDLNGSRKLLGLAVADGCSIISWQR